MNIEHYYYCIIFILVEKTRPNNYEEKIKKYYSKWFIHFRMHCIDAFEYMYDMNIIKLKCLDSIIWCHVMKLLWVYQPGKKYWCDFLLLLSMNKFMYNILYTFTLTLTRVGHDWLFFRLWFSYFNELNQKINIKSKWNNVSYFIRIYSLIIAMELLSLIFFIFALTLYLLT